MYMSHIKDEIDIVEWNEIKGKPIKILLDKELMVKILKSFDVEIEEDDLGYWLVLNKDKEVK